MSLLNYLQFQEIDPSSEEIPKEHLSNDDIALNDPVDETSLEQFWDNVVQDIHNDPEWFSFADEE